MSLETCRLEILDELLDLAWSQWTTLGVSGSTSITDHWLIDPEALVLFTCHVGRYDPRVFDAMLEWLGVHQRFINVQRLKTLSKKRTLSGGSLLSAIAHLFIGPSTRSKWSNLADQMLEGEIRQESLFYLKDGRPHPRPSNSDPAFMEAGFSRQEYQNRNAIVCFRPDYPANLILKLRALFGTNTRSEIIAYLATHSEGNPTEIAAAVGYSQKAVYNVIVDLHQSGTLSRRVKGRETLYSLREDCWSSLLRLGEHVVEWMDWRETYGFLNSIWAVLDDPKLRSENDSTVSAELWLVIGRELPNLSGLLREHLEECRLEEGSNRTDLAEICNSIRTLIGKLRN